MADRIQKQWEDNAEAFADLIAGAGTPHHKNILNPCVEELLGDVKGKSLLDAGCGEGYLARYYTKKGADVVAIDLSPTLIETSETMTEEEGLEVEYRVGDVCHVESIPNETFDIVLSNLVLLNIPCLDDSLKEYYRILKTGGHLVFSIVHPAFNFYGPGSWEMGEKDPDTNRREGLFFKMDNYFNEQEYERYWRTRKGEKFPAPISFFHRTLGTYLNALVTTGFTLVDFREPRPTDESQFFDRERRIPFFAVFKAEKL
ncbi:MAG: class I SAM-dependent methyltransferase [Candidatus Thorarchaeota archaeon]|nr:class I SAM-dependent methyltransferase [Candidatus Thorarchaeota archaeon]